MDYTIHTLLLAIDLGPHSAEVLRHAAGLAHHFGARLHIVYAIEPQGEFAQFMIDATVPEDIRERLYTEGYVSAHQEIQQRLDAFCQDVLEGHAERLVADILIVEGSPMQVILNEAQRVNAQMIVLGSHGHSAIGEVVLGSVAHKITMKATIPVLLVPLMT